MKLTKYVANRLAALGAIMVAGALALNVQAQTQPGKAVAEVVKGSVVYMTAGAAPVPLKAGTALESGTTIKTGPGSSVDLFLGKSAGYVRLPENSTLVLDKLALTDTGADTVVDIQLNLPEGTMFFDTNKKLSAASKYEVKLPNGVAGIRGSRGRFTSSAFIVLLEGRVVFVYVPASGSPTPYNLVAPPPVYFSPLEGVKTAPRELIDEVSGQCQGLGGGRARRGEAPAAPPFKEPFNSPIQGQ